MVLLLGLVLISGCSDHLPSVGDPDWPNGVQVIAMLAGAGFFMSIAYGAGRQAGFSEGYHRGRMDEIERRH
jgi:hypothetical protein